MDARYPARHQRSTKSPPQPKTPTPKTDHDTSAHAPAPEKSVAKAATLHNATPHSAHRLNALDDRKLRLTIRWIITLNVVSIVLLILLLTVVDGVTQGLAEHLRQVEYGVDVIQLS